MSSQRISCTFHSKQSLLQIYVALKEYQSLKECLESKEYDVNNGHYIMSFLTHVDPFGGWTPLHVSAFVNDPKSALILLNYGADIDARTGSAGKDSYTPLHIAVMRENREITEFLIQSKADINAKDSYKRTALELCLNNDLSILLLESGADYTGQHFDRYPLIFRAIDGRNLKLVEFLSKRMKRGIYLNNKSALEYAIDLFPECVSHLIASGIQIYFANRETDEYPIHVSIRMKRLDWIQLLCQKGCDTNVANNAGNRPLHIAVQSECPKEVILLLMSCGANPNLKNNCGLTPICYAIDQQNEELIRLFMQMNTRLSRNLSELERAINLKKFKAVLVLLESIESIDNSIGFDGQTVVWYFLKYVVGEQSDPKLMTKIIGKLIDMTSGLNTIHSVWGTLMHFLIYADICSPTLCFKPIFRQLIRSPKCDINCEFTPKDTRLKNGDEVPVDRITANGSPLSFALELTDTEFYAEELIRVGADTSTVNWDRIFFAPKKVKAFKMLVNSGGRIPDYFRDHSNPAFDDTVPEDSLPFFCTEFDSFIKWLDRHQDSPLTLKLSARSVVRKSLVDKDRRLLTKRSDPLFGPDFETFPKVLMNYIIYDSYDDFEEI